MKSLAAALAAGFALAASGGAANAQISDDVVKIGVLTDMSSLYADATGKGSWPRCRWRSPITAARSKASRSRWSRRPPEQARCRRRHRAQLVRQREGRRDLRRADLLGRAADLGADPREEQDQHQFRRRHLRPDRTGLLAQHRALDLRHLCALQCRRQGDGHSAARTPGSSSPPTMPSAWRWSATPPTS